MLRCSVERITRTRPRYRRAVLVGLLGLLACTQQVGAHKTSEAKVSKLNTPPPPPPPHSPPHAPNPPQLRIVDPKLTRDPRQPNNVVRAGLQVCATSPRPHLAAAAAAQLPHAPPTLTGQ
jgi:hypothetical protein